MDSKRALYCDILQNAFLFLRAETTTKEHSMEVADFLHNVPNYMLDDEWTEKDVNFVKFDLKGYVDRCKALGIQPNEGLVTDCEKIRDAIKASKRSKWTSFFSR